MSQDINENRSNWDDRADVHANGGYGDLQKLIEDEHAITSTVKRDLAVLSPYLPKHSIKDQRLLHLQCHIGTDTLSWWRLGAKNVHGLDFSPNSLNYAKKIAKKSGAKINYVQSDARYAVKEMSDQLASFDVIVTSAGTITWLPDLNDWAQSIADLLAPGGVFMVRDNHPLLFALDNEGLEIVADYFSGTEVSYESNASYTPDSAGKIKHTHNHNWAHDFAEITHVLIAAGLTIEAIGEEQITDWKALPMLKFSESDEGWVLPDDQPHIPLTFSIVARKKI
ncbi:class I SAM-dependent methyltransferase [Xylocopilactobacillus apicola]|uniref:SAM-dependent methyltransferase n=1 Tax=Xylocopilactobacillus apicola TaxID=2932184 RepID=A0AAU9D588_9LACO|nr:SAM-dependent methyltransferase [Xylocopilactobacillus apicola]